VICREAGFAKHFIIRPEKAPDGKAWHGNNKSCKDWLKAQKAIGKTVLIHGAGRADQGMAVALAACRSSARAILDGLIEHSMFWRDPITGIWLKARPDCIPTASGDYSDLKTKESVKHLDVQRAIDPEYGYGYIMQARWSWKARLASTWRSIPSRSCGSKKKRPFLHPCLDSRRRDIARGGGVQPHSAGVFQRCLREVLARPGDEEDASFLRMPKPPAADR